MRQEIEITDQNRDDVFRGKICPYCGAKTSFVDSAEIYAGQSHGMVYLCRPCKAWVGVHKNKKKKALGRLADKDLRLWKRHAHSCFDPLWKKKVRQGATKLSARVAAYTWLSQEMGTEPRYTHIGMFNIQQCQKVVELCKQYYKNNAA